ncbi:MAG: hypothetical protein ACHQZR_00465 [Candidatus Limnocylindrales bacterium]
MTKRLQVDVGLGAAVGLLLGLWLAFSNTGDNRPPAAWLYFGLWAAAAMGRAATLFGGSARSGRDFLGATAHGTVVALVAVVAWLAVISVWFLWAMNSFGP